MLEVFGIVFLEEVLEYGAVEEVINRLEFDIKNDDKRAVEKKKRAFLRRNLVLHEKEFSSFLNFNSKKYHEISYVINHIENASRSIDSILLNEPKRVHGQKIADFLFKYLREELNFWNWESNNQIKTDIQGNYLQNRIFVEVLNTKNPRLDSRVVNSLVNITSEMSDDIDPVIVLLLFGTNISSSLLKSLNNLTILGAELGVTVIPKLINLLDLEIEDLIQKRQEARANRDFATADQIRDQLAAQGIKLLDTKDGVRWTRD